jgi:hypothetical protein
MHQALSIGVFKKTEQPRKPNRDKKLIKPIFKTVKSCRFGSVLILKLKPMNRTEPNLLKNKRDINTIVNLTLTIT